MAESSSSQSSAGRTPANTSPARPGGGTSASRPTGKPPRGRFDWLTRLNQNALLVALTGFVLLIVAALVGYGFWKSYIEPARATAVKVGDRSYDMTYFTRRLRLELNEPRNTNLSVAQMAELPGRLGKDIIEEEVLLQRAASLGIILPGDEIDEYMAERLFLPFIRGEDGRIAYSRSLEDGVRRRLSLSGLTLAEFRRALHAQRLRQEVRKHFQDTIPEVLPAAKVSQITVRTEQKANEIKQRLDAGEDFATLARAESTDVQRSAGGALGWVSKGELAREADEAIFALAPGQVSVPIRSGDNWFLVKVEEVTEARQLTDTDRSRLAGKLYENWIEAQRKELGALHYLDKAERTDYAIRASGAIEKLRQQQNQQRPGGRAPVSIPGGLPSNMPQGGGSGAPPAQPPSGGSGSSSP